MQSPLRRHTLLYVSSSIALNPSRYRKLPYDTLKDFTQVTQVASAVGFLLIASPSLPANSLSEPIALAKCKDSKVAFGLPEEFRKFFHSEIKRYAEIVREAKIQPE